MTSYRDIGVAADIGCTRSVVTVHCASSNKLSYRRGTARRPMLVAILSTAAKLYDLLHLKRLSIGE